MPFLGSFTSRLFTVIAKIARGASLKFILTSPNTGVRAQSNTWPAYFGNSVAISDNYAIVGAYREDEVGSADTGNVYIYNVTTGVLVHSLTNPNAYGTSAFDEFGYSVAVSGNYAIVGAYGEDDAGGNQSGKAYIFNVTTGVLVHTLTNPNAYGTSAGDGFGNSVAISDNYAIVGAIDEDDAGGTRSGKAYIFNVTTGALVHTLNNVWTPENISADDRFGVKVGISGNYAIVGAYGQVDLSILPSSQQSGIVYIYNVTTGALLHAINNPNNFADRADDQFGWSVAVSGNYAIVGAPGEDDATGLVSGVVYIFNVTTGALLFTLRNPNAYDTRTNDNFGHSVAILGNYAIVGTPQEDDAGGLRSGKAYIFNVTTGAHIQSLGNPNPYSTSIEDYFGYKLAVSGDYAIVSAIGEDDAAPTAYGYPQSGKAYIFNVTTGVLLHILDNPNAGVVGNPTTFYQDQFGSSVAISGNYAIVGAIGEDGGGDDSGKVYIYNVTTGALLFTLNNPNPYSTGTYDWFSEVAVSGDYAIVGAYGEGEAGNNYSGKAYIFNVTTGALVHTLNNPNAYDTSANDEFGYEVAMSGNYAIVGVRLEDDAGGTSSGKAYIFNVTTGALVHTLNNPNAYDTSAGDAFGMSVAISDNYAIIGATGEDDAGGTSSGKAYIFNVTTGALVHTLDNPNAYGTSANDQFGSSVAISGNYAIVSTYLEDDAGGTSSGKAYIFNVTTGALVHTLNNPNAYDTSANDLFGSSVAISGNYAMVGAYKEHDADGFNSGKAYIFDVTTGALVRTLNNPNAYSAGGTTLSDGDVFGSSVAVSANYAIVGASGEAGPGGYNLGKAYIYKLALPS